jgi:hypothetical protein
LTSTPAAPVSGKWGSGGTSPWTSPITSDLIVADEIVLDQIALDGDAIYWSEAQPQKQGRTFVYCVNEIREAKRITPDHGNAFNVRTRAHEYGGGAFAVRDRTVYFSNFADQRLHRQDQGRQPYPITPADALRYADGVIDRRHGRIICVREDHTRPGKVINTLVSIDISGRMPPQILASGNDFYSTPRLSPDGDRLAWLTWNHPNMPWVATEAWVGEILSDGTIGNARRVAGGLDESVFQAEWSPDGDLYFISDQSDGWWNLYRERNGVIEPMAPMDAEFGRPQWQFGMSTYAFESAERLICSFVRDGIWKLAQIDTRTKRFDVIPTEFTGISQLRAGPGRVVFLSGTPSEASALVDLSLATGIIGLFDAHCSCATRSGVMFQRLSRSRSPPTGERPPTPSTIRRFPPSSLRQQARRFRCSSRSTEGRPLPPRARSRLRCNIGPAGASACST